MRTTILVLSALFCGLLASAGIGEAKEYLFTVGNNTKTVYCNPLEIKILNNGQQIANAFTTSPLSPNSVNQTVRLKADYCTQIQLKTVCSGQNNLHTKGCSGGSITIVSPTEMIY